MGFDLDAIKTKFDNAMKKLEDMMPDIPSIDEIKASMKAGLKKLTDAIPGPQDIKDALTDLKNEFVQDLRDLVDYLFTQLRQLIDDYIVNPINDNIVKPIEKKIEQGKQLAEDVSDSVTTAAGATKDFVVEKSKPVIDYVSKFFKKDTPAASQNNSPGFPGNNKVNNTPADGSLELNTTMYESLQLQREGNKFLKKLVNQGGNNMLAD